MTKPPRPTQRVTQEFLNTAFADAAMIERLKTCGQSEFYNRPTPPEAGLPLGTSTIGYKFHDHAQNLIAVVFHYRTPTGQLARPSPSPKGLLIDDIWHYR